jgi:hypothetical protein
MKSEFTNSKILSAPQQAFSLKKKVAEYAAKKMWYFGKHKLDVFLCA